MRSSQVTMSILQFTKVNELHAVDPDHAGARQFPLLPGNRGKTWEKLEPKWQCVSRQMSLLKLVEHETRHKV
jgi:hypothetical protein